MLKLKINTGEEVGAVLTAASMCNYIVRFRTPNLFLQQLLPKLTLHHTVAASDVAKTRKDRWEFAPTSLSSSVKEKKRKTSAPKEVKSWFSVDGNSSSYTSSF